MPNLLIMKFLKYKNFYLSLFVCLFNIYCYGNLDDALHNTYLVKIKVTGSSPYNPPEDTWYDRAFKNKQLRSLNAEVLEVYNGPKKLIGKEISLLSPRLQKPESGSLIHTYSYEGVTIEGNEPIGAEAVLPLIKIKEEYISSIFPHNEFLKHSIFSIVHPMAREVVWDRKVGHVNFDRRIFSHTLEWANMIRLYNEADKANKQVKMLIENITNDNPLVGVSFTHILFRDHQNTAINIAKKLIHNKDTPIISKVALDHELTIFLGDAWRNNGQNEITRELKNFLKKGERTKIKEIVDYRNRMLTEGLWSKKVDDDVLFVNIYGAKTLPIFEGYLVEGLVKEVIRGRRNILTGEIIKDNNHIHDAVVSITNVYVGPKHLENEDFSIRGNVIMNFNNEQVTLRPVIGVQADGLSEGDRGLWHLVTAHGDFQKAYLGSLFMTKRGYGGYIPFNDSDKSRAWRKWAQIMREILAQNNVNDFKTFENLLSSETPEIAIWACHAVARRFGSSSIEMLFNYISERDHHNQVWLLIGMDDAFKSIFKEWFSSPDRLKVFQMIIEHNIEDDEAEDVVSYITLQLKDNPLWSSEKYSELYNVAVLKDGVHKSIREMSSEFAIKALGYENNENKDVKSIIINTTLDAEIELRSLLIKNLIDYGLDKDDFDLKSDKR